VLSVGAATFEAHIIILPHINGEPSISSQAQQQHKATMGAPQLDVYSTVACKDPFIDIEMGNVVPLIEIVNKDDDSSSEERGGKRSLRAAVIPLGCTIGFFLQFSTLGMNAAVWGSTIPVLSAPVVIFNMAWILFTATLPVTVWFLLRDLEARKGNMLVLECQFIAGGTLGVCLAWNLIDLALGIPASPCITFIAAVVCFFVTQSGGKRNRSGTR